ncbi:MAG: prefoldin subunit alpha [Candidatus Methanomethylicia archaeon]|jgi:prefoldin alpha subunit|uniref:Prefoldin subunit alpha n=1 Tax=Thermoproteota archaeon TaxID=2056631 RepID=A0A523BCR0_9CREN|nr:prefoldin subunit alpha [Candidatus Methanomethylicia archaeon]MCQ5374305.1 prefoldin subunit alpha [Candidatus Methanomethylicia archaeon]NHV60303.1 prefoldin subunit alpha [Candidatus Verstraetearchaeota archaeon]TDA38733.1 MAG: prefoldin subunit alpha [Candidatus Verstraetearchaeota archaeon]
MSSSPRPAKPLTPKEELDPLLVEFSNLKAYADVLRQQIEFTTGALAELTLSKASLYEIKNREGKAETLIHIGAGNYIRAFLQDVKTVVVGVGSGISIEKSIDTAISDIEDRIKKAQMQISSLQNQYLQVAARLDQLQARIDQLYSQIEASGKA